MRDLENHPHLDARRKRSAISHEAHPIKSASIPRKKISIEIAERAAVVEAGLVLQIAHQV